MDNSPPVDTIQLGRLTIIPHEAARKRGFLERVFGDEEQLRNILRQYIPHWAQPSVSPEKAVADITYPKNHFTIDLERGKVELTVVTVNDLASLGEDTLQQWGLYHTGDIPNLRDNEGSSYLLAASYLRTSKKVGLDDKFSPYDISPISQGSPVNYLQQLVNFLCSDWREVPPQKSNLDLHFFFYGGQVAAALSNPTSERIREAEPPIQEYFCWMEQNASALRTIAAAHEYAIHNDHSATFFSGLSKEEKVFGELAKIAVATKDLYHNLADRTMAALLPPVNNRLDFLAAPQKDL